MKKKLLIVSAFLIVLVGLADNVFAQQTAFQPGEKITYNIYYNVIGLYVNAGTASFTTSLEKYNDNDVFHVVGEGTSNKHYDWIFKVRDKYESYFDAANLQSYRFIRTINEGKYKKHEEVLFNQKTNTAITSQGVFKVPASVQDVINTVYNARNVNYNRLKPGDKVSFAMFLDNQVYNMYIRYIGKETITTKYGTFNTIKLKPLLLKGEVFKGGENMTMWVTDDNNHIPVRIESPISVGSIKVDLMQYTNLLHPLNSLVAMR